jgi:hypothetical protein
MSVLLGKLHRDIVDEWFNYRMLQGRGGRPILSNYCLILRNGDDQYRNRALHEGVWRKNKGRVV